MNINVWVSAALCLSTNEKMIDAIADKHAASRLYASLQQTWMENHVHFLQVKDVSNYPKHDLIYDRKIITPGGKYMCRTGFSPFLS